MQACAELQGYNVLHRPRPASTRSARSGGGAATSPPPRRRTGRRKRVGREPQPGLALLRLAQGKVEAAASAIRRELGDRTRSTRSRARSACPRRSRSRSRSATLRRAREAAEELEEIADTFLVGGKRTPALEGRVCLAWGQIRLAEQDWEGPREALREPRATLGAGRRAVRERPQARMLLGLAYRGEGDEDGAPRGARRREGARSSGSARCSTLQRTTELLGEVGRPAHVHVHGHRRLDEARSRRSARRSGRSSSPGTTARCAS